MMHILEEAERRGVRPMMFLELCSGMLGHADPGFTLRTYPFAHTSNPMQVKAAETIGSVMGKNL